MLYNKDWEKTETAITPSLLLDQCADHLEQYGWCQNTIGSRFAPMCTVGVIHAVGTTLYSEIKRDLDRASAINKWNCLLDRASDTLREYLEVWDLVDWNNAPGRTKEEVIAAFRAAAKNAEV